MGKVVNHAKFDPEDPELYPGVLDVNRAGAALAVEMLAVVEDTDSEEGEPSLGELAEIENWPRLGRPHRNVLAEYLARARAAGPEVEEGFCAVLSSYIGMASQGTTAHSDWYAATLGLPEAEDS